MALPARCQGRFLTPLLLLGIGLPQGSAHAVALQELDQSSQWCVSAEAGITDESSNGEIDKAHGVALIQRDTRLVFKTDSLHALPEESSLPLVAWARKQAPDVQAVATSLVAPGPGDLFGQFQNISGSGSDEFQAQLGLTWNSCDDLHNIVTSLAFNCIIIILYLGIFYFLRRAFPLVFSFNFMAEPSSAPKGRTPTLDEVTKSAGLDAAMFVEFCNLGMRLSVSIGVPMCVVLIPIYAHFNHTTMSSPRVHKMQHYNLTAQSEMQTCTGGLQYLSLSSVPAGSSFYWVVAALVWVVVIVTQSLLVSAQASFQTRRAKWLKDQPRPRSSTLLVANIPPAYRSDTKLREYFENLFPGGVIERVYVAKHVDKLNQLTNELRDVEQQHTQAQFEWKLNGMSPEMEPKVLIGPGVVVGAVEHYQKLMEKLQNEINYERQRVLTDNSAYGSEGFVTFRSRRDRETTMRLQLEQNTEVFSMDCPPDPSDVRYSDLLQDPSTRKTLHAMGYVLMVVLFILVFPIISALSFVLNLENIRQIHFIDYILVHLPIASSLLEGVFATLALSIFMGFLPTILRAIISSCFSLKAEVLSQYYLQQWYFWFQVVFVLLITAVGGSVLQRAEEIYQNPHMVFDILATNLPYATRFYIDYIILQWSTNVLSITRYMNLLKFLGLRTVCDDTKAKELSEPEDQDYNGIGSRSARLTLIMVCGLVFCTLTPVILVATFIFFSLCRYVYTYLIVFAETKKVDLGGYFWCLQLHHLQMSMPIYIFTMAGVLFHNSHSQWPGIVALLSLSYLIYSYIWQFKTLSWETLSFRELVQMERDMSTGSPQTVQGRYEQPYLDGPDKEPDASPDAQAGAGQDPGQRTLDGNGNPFGESAREVVNPQSATWRQSFMARMRHRFADNAAV